MDSEQHHYELRSRSRSRSHTPLIHSQALMDMEQAEHHYDLRSKSRERSHTPGETTSSRRSGSRSIPSSASKVRDQNMQTITENTGRSVSLVAKKVERRSQRQRAKRQIFANGQDETKEETSVNEFEQTRKSITPHRVLTSDYSSEEGEREDLPSRPGSAYEIYKQAGEWWNKFPKTDYTYSQKSQCRYEIAPGILAMPNMSRRPIHSDGSNNVNNIISTNQDSLGHSLATTESGLGDTLDSSGIKNISNQNFSMMDDLSTSQGSISKYAPRTMMFKQRHEEQYTVHKEIIYAGSKSFRQRYSSFAKPIDTASIHRYDSDIKLDEVVSKTIKNTQRWKITQQVQRFSTVIVAWFLKLFEFLKLRTSKKREYRTYHENTYYNESYWRKPWRLLIHSVQSIYFFLAELLLFDCWVLTQFSGLRKRLLGSRIIWIPIIPFFLLAGYLGMSYVLSYLSTLKMQVTNNSETNELVETLQRFTHEETGHEEYSTTDHNQTEYLLNISRVLHNPKEEDSEIWQRFNVKVMEIEKRLDNLKTGTTNDIVTIKAEFQTLRELYLQLKSCCDADKEILVPETLHVEIDKVIGEYFGSTVSKKDLSFIINKLKNLSVNMEVISNIVPTSSDYNIKDTGILDERIHQIVNDRLKVYDADKTSRVDYNIEDTDMLDERIHQIVNDRLKVYDADKTNRVDYNIEDTGMLDEKIHKIVNDRLKVYDADKTGRVDYALESAGGEIISTRCTQTYDIKSGVLKLLGFTIYSKSNNPQTVIQGNPIQPGACWPFQGFPGYLLIKLRSSIYVTGFTIEHAPKSILPSGEMKSAPRKFNVWGFTDQNDPEPVLFGNYEFTDSENNLQYFPVQNTNIVIPYEYIELRIHSNLGELEYTCLYRFRVHGNLA